MAGSLLIKGFHETEFTPAGEEILERQLSFDRREVGFQPQAAVVHVGINSHTAVVVGKTNDTYTLASAHALMAGENVVVDCRAKGTVVAGRVMDCRPGQREEDQGKRRFFIRIQ